MINGNNSFEEIIIKANVDYYIFKSYFHQSKNEYNVHNSLRINSKTHLLSGLGLFNLFEDFKINLNEQINSKEVILYSIDKVSELDAILNFFIVEERGNHKTLKKIFPKYVILFKGILSFYERFLNYFDKIVMFL